MINDYIKNSNAKAHLIKGTIIFFIFIGFDLIMKILTKSIAYSSFVSTLPRFIISMVLALSCYRSIKTQKIFEKSLTLSKSTFILLRTLLLLLVFILLMLLGIPSHINQVFDGGIKLIAITFILAISPGVFEEFLVRGLFFAGFLKMFQNNTSKLLYASFLSSLLFGMLHFYNLTEKPFYAVSQQVFYAVAMGLVFSVIRIKFNNLWISIAIHALIDFQPYVSTKISDESNWLPVLIIFLPIAIFSIIVLSKLDKDYIKQSKLINNQ